MNILIVGCGIFGKSLINALSNLSEPPYIVVIDRNPESFEDLPVGFGGHTIAGDASNISLLEEANIKKMGVFIATTNSGNLNLMLAHVAKENYHVPQVMARVTDDGQRQLGDSIGITAINPLEWVVADLLTQWEFTKEESK